MIVRRLSHQSSSSIVRFKHPVSFTSTLHAPVKVDGDTRTKMSKISNVTAFQPTLGFATIPGYCAFFTCDSSALTVESLDAMASFLVNGVGRFGGA